MDRQAFITSLERHWATDHRWDGIRRPYGAGDVYRLRGSIDIEYSLARHGAARLWQLLQQDNYLAVLSAITGNQAIQQVQAGLNAIYVSGWQVAADANNALEMYPDQSLYPSDSVPALLRRINNALKRADEIAHLKDDHSVYWFAPLVADAEAGFGGPLHAFEIMKNMIDAGAAGVHFEDQLASVKKCGHLGGKVLVPTSEFITKLVAARLATDVCGVGTVLIARTDANSATLLTSDCDEYDQRFVTGERTAEASSACGTASRPPSPARSPTRRTPISCGSRRRTRTSRRRRSSRRRSTRNSPASGSPTTAPRRSTGAST